MDGAIGSKARDLRLRARRWRRRRDQVLRVRRQRDRAHVRWDSPFFYPSSRRLGTIPFSCQAPRIPLCCEKKENVPLASVRVGQSKHEPLPSFAPIRRSLLGRSSLFPTAAPRNRSFAAKKRNVPTGRGAGEWRGHSAFSATPGLFQEDLLFLIRKRYPGQLRQERRRSSPDIVRV